jgi:predicted transcriptional regulator
LKKLLPKRKAQEIGKRIWAVRTALGLDQKVLAKKIGFSQALISQYENGQTEVTLYIFLLYQAPPHFALPSLVLHNLANDFI